MACRLNGHLVIPAFIVCKYGLPLIDLNLGFHLPTSAAKYWGTTLLTSSALCHWYQVGPCSSCQSWRGAAAKGFTIY